MAPNLSLSVSSCVWCKRSCVWVTGDGTQLVNRHSGVWNVFSIVAAAERRSSPAAPPSPGLSQEGLPGDLLVEVSEGNSYGLGGFHTYLTWSWLVPFSLINLSFRFKYLRLEPNAITWCFLAFRRLK